MYTRVHKRDLYLLCSLLFAFCMYLLIILPKCRNIFVRFSSFHSDFVYSGYLLPIRSKLLKKKKRQFRQSRLKITFKRKLVNTARKLHVNAFCEKRRYIIRSTYIFPTRIERKTLNGYLTVISFSTAD